MRIQSILPVRHTPCICSVSHREWSAQTHLGAHLQPHGTAVVVMAHHRLRQRHPRSDSAAFGRHSPVQSSTDKPLLECRESALQEVAKVGGLPGGVTIQTRGSLRHTPPCKIHTVCRSTRRTAAHRPCTPHRKSCAQASGHRVCFGLAIIRTCGFGV